MMQANKLYLNKIDEVVCPPHLSTANIFDRQP